MRKQSLVWSVLATGLLSLPAGAVEFFLPIPNLGTGLTFRTEFFRQDLSKDDVTYIWVADGGSTLGLPRQHFAVLPGPSTDRNHPLLTDNYNRDYARPPARSNPRFYPKGSGLVVMEGEPGLLGIETAVEVGGDPTTAWEIPMVTEDDAFKPGSTAYVLNLMKDATTASEISLYNLEGAPGKCNLQVLAPKGGVIEERTGITVPAVGVTRIANILAKVAAPATGAVAGINVAVTCDHPFYAIGSFPSKSLDAVRVHYPSPDAPSAPTAQTLVSGVDFRCTRTDSVRRFDLALEPDVQYRMITIDFDLTAASPTNGAFYRGLLGMWRDEPGQRFGKTLYFGVNERFDRSKLLVDLGTPYIEIMTKKGKAPLVGGKTYHVRIEANADQHSFRQLVTTAGGAVLADMRSGLYNDDFITRNGKTVSVGFGLPGIGDGAYSPPYGFKFGKITIVGYK